MGGKGKSWSGEAWKEDGPSLLGHQLAFTLFLKVHKCYVMARSSKGLGPENYGLEEGEADSQGSGHAVRRLSIDSRHGCIKGRMNVLLSFPLVRAVSLA